MAKTENQKKLLKILNEIFQLDQSDLDFGIYRIMNTKSKEINEFLDNDLLSSVANAFSSNDNSSIQKELDKALQQAQSLGADPETLPKVIALREELSSTSSSSSLENDVFSHLAIFFKRYYKDGDFVSLRRYKKESYAIPYEGEEVKLHWANSDQYYIKSGEYFRDYSFVINDKKIHFKLTDAKTQQNNNKATSDKERRFVILESNPCEVVEGELYINFEYRAVGKGFKQDKLNLEAIAKVVGDTHPTKEEFINALNTLAPTEKNKTRTIFEKHLKSYTSRNSFDYFIHKDLGGFLSRELDFYIKNEMLFLDDILLCPLKYEEVMGKIKIFKEVASKIIAFLTQLEELQKKLWEKKKFIIETHYCITLDKINEKYYDKIFACKEQLAEWKNLFDKDIKTIEDLKEEKYLVLDTKFFDTKFKYKLLSEFDNLDEELDGVLINSENFGALNLLQERYKEQIKTVYIDPPYNTGNDGFLYNDSYQHSSWMSFMYDRLVLGRELMSDDGVIFSSIDDRELNNLLSLQNVIFGNVNFFSNFIWQKRSGSMDSVDGTSVDHEYILCYGKEKNSLLGVERKYEKYKNPDNDPRGEWISDNLSAGKAGGDVYYKITDPNTGNTFLPPKGRYWPYSPSTMKQKILEGRILFPKNKNGRPMIKRFKNEAKSDYLPVSTLIRNHTEKKLPNNVITSALNTFGTSEIQKLFNNKQFSFPKSTIVIKSLISQVIKNKNSTILDYFAGSGTTGHAVINLNREDKGKRKYILVEMGEYFDSVTKPRIQKVIYSDSWKDGKPTTKNGISQMFKYFKLESYEDTLNNLEFNKTKEQQQTFDYYPQAKEDYILNYSLDVESQASLLDIDSFKSPFDYKLKIASSSVGETKESAIDLVETFNYLLGLVVEKTTFNDGFLTIKGKNLKGSKILVLWRDNKTSDELDAFVKKISLDEFDEVYVNGDNHLEKTKLIEEAFKKLMFNE